MKIQVRDMRHLPVKQTVCLPINECTVFIISIPVTDKLDILPSDGHGSRATLNTKSAFSCCLCVFVLLAEARAS